MVQSGRFITLEGIDAAGKTTHLHAIDAYLRARQINVVLTHEPGGSALGERLRQQLLGADDGNINAIAELLLFFAARAQHIEEVIAPALEAGKWVVCDRFTDASYAYQGAGRGLGFDPVAQLEHLVQGQLRPHLTLLLDLPVSVSRQRYASTRDRFERQDPEFQEHVRAAYLKLAKAQPQRIKIIAAQATQEQVKCAIINALDEFCRNV